MAARTVLVIMSTLCEGARQDAFQLFKGGDLIRNAFVDKVLRANLANRGRWVRCQLAAVAPGLSILTALLTVLAPVICYLLDRVFKTTECTVGYHVTARKK